MFYQTDLNPSAMGPRECAHAVQSSCEKNGCTLGLCEDSQMCICEAPWVALCPLLGIWTADSSSIFDWDASMPEGQMSMANMEGNGWLCIPSIFLQLKKTKQKNAILDFFPLELLILIDINLIDISWYSCSMFSQSLFISLRNLCIYSDKNFTILFNIAGSK